LDLKKRNKVSHLNRNSLENNDSHEPEVNEVYENEWNIRIRQKLGKCMEHLTEKQKEILYLRFQGKLSYAEIAVILGIAVDSCQKLVYRTLKLLREDLEKLDGIGNRLILFFIHK
jgi:RNA polymerase sigma factor (sigma-70 family)